MGYVPIGLYTLFVNDNKGDGLENESGAPGKDIGDIQTFRCVELRDLENRINP